MSGQTYQLCIKLKFPYCLALKSHSVLEVFHLIVPFLATISISAKSKPHFNRLYIYNQTQTHQIQMPQVVSTKFYRLFLNKMIRPPDFSPPSPALPPRARRSRPTSEAAPVAASRKGDVYIYIIYTYVYMGYVYMYGICMYHIYISHYIIWISHWISMNIPLNPIKSHCSCESHWSSFPSYVHMRLQNMITQKKSFFRL